MSESCPRCLDLRPGDLLSPAAIQWLKTGRRGVSSEAIFSHMTGIPLNKDMSPPYDVGDYKRCRDLLVAVPEFSARIGEMATVGTLWRIVVEHWDSIGMLIERGDSDGAYQRMRNIYEEYYAEPRDAP